uniref:Uncharacterized protein n=1 Tax=Rhizophora mucronata TaxID=61149 RepID=A0A2P2NUZ0_RHIMU
MFDEMNTKNVSLRYKST